MEHYFTNNENLRSEIRKINYTFNETPFVFFSDLGVFSKDKIDYGSKLMLESYLLKNPTKKRVLDMGCGYGLIGIVISKITDSFVTLVDVNKRAVHLTSRNIVENDTKCETFVSDIYSEVTDKYDVIITNPPLRAGKNCVIDILKNARDYLKSDGELWYVIRKDQGVKSINKLLEDYYKLEIITKSKGFYVVKATLN